MDYEVKRDDGTLIWYKLVGHNVIPIEGRCSKDAVLLHDGIVVVPDSKTAQKVAGIDGLLEYRKDKQELYIRSNKTWNVLAQKNEILQETSEVDSKLNNVDQKLSKQIQTMDLQLVEFEKKINKLMNFGFKPTRQECSNYTLLDNKDRNIKYRSGKSSLLCDSGISTGWYRFGGDAGTQLSTTCVPRIRDTNNLKCRTHCVSWLNGTHPSVGDGKVTRRVCFSWAGKCCFANTKTYIEVINCGFFYIYKLVSPPSCSYRYCGTDV
ncbi:Hypothetical predicted protein [Paramuricea clavata]|uniref:UMOD/GP2/OIT3-like D8C domain-containing protein n=1 Tax=Paramuricea clavata TaxID=317549 RepID=A0A6S7FWM6_PARCT|nr:Hypothetical predicted protein [Paramuricea clavata]